MGLLLALYLIEPPPGPPPAPTKALPSAKRTERYVGDVSRHPNRPVVRNRAQGVEDAVQTGPHKRYTEQHHEVVRPLRRSDPGDQDTQKGSIVRRKGYRP